MGTLNRESLKNILIVDDSSTSRMIIKRCLEISGFLDCSYYYANNGLEALDIIHSKNIDLIITDVNMPKMDGKNLVRKLKSDNKTDHIPIIVTTSLGDSLIEDEFKNLGVSWVIKKPVVPKKIIELFGDI